MKVKQANKKIINCPECNNSKATITSLPEFILICIAAISICFLVSLFIPVLGWILAPIFFILGTITIFILLPISCIIGGGYIQCKECNKTFRLNREEFKRYKNK